MSIQGKRPVAVLASGPSLLGEDIEALRAASVPLIAVNCTWRMAPDSIAIVAGDARWWKAHHADIDAAREVAALRITRAQSPAQHYGARVMRSRAGTAYNSGQVAIEWAVRKRFDPIILLGFDVSLRHGLHHHGPHTQTPNPDVDRVKHWHRQFAALAQAYPKANIVNCSRYTELTIFPLQPLDEMLCEHG